MKRVLGSVNEHLHGGFIRRICRFFSIRAEVPSSSRNGLCRRIFPSPDPNVSIVPILGQWMEEGRSISVSELVIVTKKLRRNGRYKHALEVSNWAIERRMCQLCDRHAAIHLDLISKVHGLKEAEKYVNNLPVYLKGVFVDGALLNCYAENSCVQKAEALMQKMKKMQHVRHTLVYNVMLSLYSKTGEFAKLEKLVQEMEIRNIWQNKRTMAIRLAAYASSCDIEGMEKLLAKIESDPMIILAWNMYTVVANGYIKAGLIEKALDALKKLEDLIMCKDKSCAYRMLLSQYGSCGRKEEVYRIWNLYKKGSFGCQNRAYICVISSLLRMDDIDGAEMIFNEWESKHVYFDFKVLNLLVKAYCRKGLIEKAEHMVDSVINSGKEPTSWTWDVLAGAYYESNRFDDAINAVKKAFLAAKGPWEPKHISLASCVNYLKKKGDVSTIMDFINNFRKRGCLPENIYEEIVSSSCNQGEGSGEVSSETKKGTLVTGGSNILSKIRNYIFMEDNR